MGGRAPLEPGRQSRQVITRFGIQFDEQVTQLAEREGITRSQLIRQAVNDYLARRTEEAAVT